MDDMRKRTNPFVGVLATLYGVYLIYGIGGSMIDHYSAAKLTQHMKTACVGRFLVDLPQSMDFSYSQTYVDGLWISSQEESGEAFDARVLARQKELDLETNALGKKTLEKVEDYDNNGFSGKMFVFGRKLTLG